MILRTISCKVKLCDFVDVYFARDTNGVFSASKVPRLGARARFIGESEQTRDNVDLGNSS